MNKEIFEKEIDIVTAFFDIGRGHPPKKIIPFLRGISKQDRSVEEYFKYFENLAKIENSLVVYTTENFKERILSIRKKNGLVEKTKVIVVEDYYRIGGPEQDKKAEEAIHSKIFIKNAMPRGFIQFWNYHYSTMTNSKPYYVCNAIENGYVKSEIVAWVDFGYCRNHETLLTKKWFYDFKKNKVSVYKMDDIDISMSKEDFVFKDFRNFQGGIIVSGHETWFTFKNLMFEKFKKMLSINLLTTEEKIMAMVFLDNPEIFEPLQASRNKNGYNWFEMFKEYNVYCLEDYS